MKINIDSKKIQELLTRSVENIYPKKEFLEARLKEDKQLTLYAGYDPTADTLHIGHGITLLKLRQFQELGHQVIMLIGDFTGMIGDPTDKTAARKKLSRKEVLVNCKNYQKQASSILDFEGKNKAAIKFNSKWLGKMKFDDVLELTAHFTVQQMVERDMFERRIKEEKPIYLHEFLYPLMQGYDSVAMNVDGEVGGNDQTFNMLAGRTLMKAILGKEKFVLTTKLLADDSGKKMGKSEGNMIALSDTPEDMFGKVMRWSDAMIAPGFELCTRLPMDEVRDVLKAPNPRDAKLRLAFEITRTFLGEKEAAKGRNHFSIVIQDKDKPIEIPKFKLKQNDDIVSILLESKLCLSRTEARRIIAQGGVYINSKRVTSSDVWAKVKRGDIVKKGNRGFIEII